MNNLKEKTAKGIAYHASAQRSDSERVPAIHQKEAISFFL
jgi:hypothetical protein